MTTCKVAENTLYCKLYLRLLVKTWHVKTHQFTISKEE